MSSDALPLLSIRGVGKTYAQPVLAEIDLQLFGGEVLALTGEMCIRDRCQGVGILASCYQLF